MAPLPYPPGLREGQIADYLLVECRERGELLTNLKLQKLLYYAQAWYLALHSRELFDEDFKAWVHGPVLLSQYHRFKNYGWHPIDAVVQRPNLESAIKDHLDEVIDVFGAETAVALELMTHRERPWMEACGNTPMSDPSNAVILKHVMAAYYRTL